MVVLKSLMKLALYTTSILIINTNTWGNGKCNHFTIINNTLQEINVQVLGGAYDKNCADNKGEYIYIPSMKESKELYVSPDLYLAVGHGSEGINVAPPTNKVSHLYCYDIKKSEEQWPRPIHWACKYNE